MEKFNDKRTDATPSSTLKRLRLRFTNMEKFVLDFTYLSFGKSIEVKLPLLMFKHENRSTHHIAITTQLLCCGAFQFIFLFLIRWFFDVCVAIHLGITHCHIDGRFSSAHIQSFILSMEKMKWDFNIRSCEMHATSSIISDR